MSLLFAGLLEFLTVWIAVLVVSYALGARFIGLTLLFTASTVLYVLLPNYFFPDDVDLFPQLAAAVVLGATGYFVGLTAISGLSERRLFAALPLHADWDRIGRTALVLSILSLTLLFILHPEFVIGVGTYGGRIEFAAQYGPLVFLLNQAVIGSAILIIWAYKRGRLSLALAISAVEVVWAIYSSAKISLLATCAAWAAILLFATWRRRLSHTTTLTLIGLMLPASLTLMLFYAILRSGVTDLSLAYEIFTANLDRIGPAGVHVGDFNGPYWVLVQHLRDNVLELTLGASYFEQLLVLIPRVLRSGFLDLTDAFAKRQFGPAYVPGLGFSFSPWAEAYMNFRVPGFFVQGLLFGLFTRVVIGISARLVGFNEVVIFFQVVLITYFERNHLVGQLKATIVYCLPFLMTWMALDILLNKAPARLRSLSMMGGGGPGAVGGGAGAASGPPGKNSR